MGRERELKYRPTDAVQAAGVVDLLLADPPGVVSPPVVVTLDTVYVDDDRGTLGARGVALRHRSVGGSDRGVWGLKALVGAPEGREWEFAEWETEGRRDVVPAAVSELLGAVGASPALAPIAHMRVVRERWRVTCAQAWADLCLDRVAVSVPRAEEFVELEFESDDVALVEWARRVIETGPSPPPASRTSKLETALGVVAQPVDAEVAAWILGEGIR